jgi:hypothetical protein
MTPAHDQLTVAQAAKTSGLSPSTLKRRIAAKQLQAHCSPTGIWLIERSTLLAYLAQQPAPTGKTDPSNRSGATTEGSTERAVIEHLGRSLEREKTLNADLMRANGDLQAQNKELQAEVLKFNAEMLAMLRGDGKGMLSRWLRK